MTKISLELIRSLSDSTGVSLGEAKTALEKAGGRWDYAVRYLRETGQPVVRRHRCSAFGHIYGYDTFLDRICPVCNADDREL